MNRAGIFVLVAAILVVLLIFGCTSKKGSAPESLPPTVNAVSGISRPNWNLASLPVVIDDSLSERGRLAWYNPLDGYPINEIWDTDIGPGETNITNILVLEYRPVDFIRIKDSNNCVIDTSSHQIPPELSWGGIMCPLSRPTSLAFQDATYLDIRLRGDIGIMHVDLGRISEDIDGDGWPDNEDIDGFRILDDEEDVGLDGLPDSLECGYDPISAPDPAGDNWSMDDIWHINGTEGNREDPDGGYYPDTEDRNYNGLELTNEYFSYRIDLSDNRCYYVPLSRNEYDWKTIRLPLGDQGVSDTVINTPDWDNIRFIRIWIDSADASYINNSLKIELAAITLDVSYDTVTPPPHYETHVVKDVDYKKRHIFDLGRIQMTRSRSDTMPEPDKYDFMPGDSILKAIVYYDDNTPNDSIRLLRTPCICYIDPEDTLSDDTLGVYRTEGYFDPVEEISYYINPTSFYIQFLQSIIGSDDLIGVYMEVRRENGIIDTIGDISSEPFLLKLIRPRHYIDVNHHVWEYQWKNVYWLGAWNLNLENLDIIIHKGTPINNTDPNPEDLNHQEGYSYLQIFGLDQGDNFGYGHPDNEVDRVLHIDPVLGFLYFPSRHPFDSRISYLSDPFSGEPIYLMDSVPEMYNSTSIPVHGSKYYLAIKRLVY